MEEALDSRIGELIDWMVAEALNAGLDDYQRIYSDFWDRFHAAGIPLLRVHAAMQTLHPLMNAISLTWHRGEDTVLDTYRVDDGADSEAWEKNPLKVLVDNQESFCRHRLPPTSTIANRHPILKKFSDNGATDYLGFTVRFAPGDMALNRQGGMIASFTTDQAGGFTKQEIDLIKRVLPRFALVAKLAGRERLFHNVIEAYLGTDAGARVREGQISLGSGQMIDAVIWFSDLRNSTPLAEKLGHEHFLTLLNDYFSALAGAVMDSGGVVLRFIGDAALAIFPIADDRFTEIEARKLALVAAKDAIVRAETVNAERAARGDEPFGYGIGLHVGRIMYGNIGVPSRVEFSVIGPAANEAARIESMTKTLNEHVVVSEAFAGGLEEPFRDLGTHELRGASKPVQLFGLANS